MIASYYKHLQNEKHMPQTILSHFMPSGAPLLIGPDERAALHDLRDRATRSPVDMTDLIERLKLPKIKTKHMRQMTEQTVYLPAAYAVTFSIETNHPESRTARHMTMSVDAEGRLPNRHAVWMVAEELGFIGNLELCQGIWVERLQGHGEAVNIVQLLGTSPGSG